MDETKPRDLLRELLYEYVDFDDWLLYVENRSYDDLTDLWIDFLNNCEVDLKWIKERFEKWIEELDLNNEEFWCFSNWWDAVMEQSDTMIDIYNADLREKAQDYQDYIEEVIDDFWSDVVKDWWLIRLFQYWQGRYYERLYYDVLNAVEKILQDWENIDEEYKG